MELISLVPVDMVQGKAVPLCFSGSQEQGEQGREGESWQIREGFGEWVQGGVRGSRRDLWRRPEDLRVALERPWLDVQHHLQSWRWAKGDVKRCFTPCLLAASSAASLSLAKVLFISFNGPGVEIWASGDTSHTPWEPPCVRVPNTTCVSYGQALYPDQLQTHFPLRIII